MCFGRVVTLVEALGLIVAGTLAGVFSTVVGLASLVSYPALLAIGLPPVSANMTNTVSLLFTGLGAAAGSRPELAGQGARIRRLALVTALGGGAGAALLLITPAQAFTLVAPVLIGASSLLLLIQPRRDRKSRRGGDPGGPPRSWASLAGIRACPTRSWASLAGIRAGRPGAGRPWRGSGPARRGAGRPWRGSGPARRGAGRPWRGSGPADAERDGHGGRAAGDHGQPPLRERHPWLLAGVFGVAVYVGYFGAAGGIMMLAVLGAMVAEPLARTNAVKNILGMVANTVAAVAFAVFGHVDWAAVVPLAAGFVIGGWTGPALVRRIPAQALRILIVVCGLAVATKLGLSVY